MANVQDQIMKFTVEFNSVMANGNMPRLEKISKLLALQKQFDILPNEQSKVTFKLHSNLEIGRCYYKTCQRYMLTPIIAECKELLLKKEEHDFATQPQEVWTYLADRMEDYYCDLIYLCRVKNHQRDIAYCYQEIARIWDKVGSESNCIKSFVLSNIALSQVPGTFALSKEQLTTQFPEYAEFIAQSFRSELLIKRDPVEQSQRYIEVYDEAERIISGLLEQEEWVGSYRQNYWRVKAEVLKFHFGIEWKSPEVLNPNSKF